MSKSTIFILLCSLSTAILLQYVNPHLPNIRYIRLENFNFYVSFLVGVASICSLLIGLYFAALTTAISTAYKDVPEEIRQLLIHEKMGSIYLKTLAYTTVLALCLVVFRLLGYVPILSAALLLLLLSAISIVGFVKLGQRSFYYLDPSKLSYTVRLDLVASLKNVSVGSFQWGSNSFQDAERKNAARAVQNLKHLSEICVGRAHLADKPHLELGINVLEFLSGYQNLKRSIPSVSGGDKLVH